MNVEPGIGSLLITVAVPQLSEAVGVAQFTAALQAPELTGTFMLEGHVEKTGFTLSTTVIVNVQVSVFPFPSLAV